MDDSLTVGSALTIGTEVLASAGVESPRAEAMEILMFATSSRREDLIIDPFRLLGCREVLIFQKALALREARRPLAYITGERWFYGRPFKINRAVLIPRPETEMLVEFIREKANGLDASLSIADIGTGSGIIAISAALELKNSRVDAVDLSTQALLVAKKNAKRHHVEERLQFFPGDLFAPLVGKSYDIIVSNPPYISPADVPHLMPEVSQYEPEIALSHGATDDGMGVHRRLIIDAEFHLKPGGWLVLEVGVGQADSVSLFASQRGYKSVHSRRDLGGIERVVAGQWLPIETSVQ